VHLHQPIGQDTSTSRGDTTEDVEDGVTLANIVSDIPGAKQVDTTGEKASLYMDQHTNQRSSLSSTHL